MTTGAQWDLTAATNRDGDRGGFPVRRRSYVRRCRRGYYGRWLSYCEKSREGKRICFTYGQKYAVWLGFALLQVMGGKMPLSARLVHSVMHKRSACQGMHLHAPAANTLAAASLTATMLRLPHA